MSHEHRIGVVELWFVAGMATPMNVDGLGMTEVDIKRDSAIAFCGRN